MRVNAIVLLFAALFGAIAGQGCPRSKLQRFKFNKRASRLESRTLPCLMTEQLIKLDVPDGYESVTPSVDIVSRCSGHLCNKDKRCVATEVSTKEIVIMAKNGSEMECQTLQVEVHNACACRCIEGPEQCVNWEIFDEENCSCRCPSGAREKCQQKGDQYNFDDEKCKCVDMSNSLAGK